jgi:NifU-like protein involved in Fe-S cluster formation
MTPSAARYSVRVLELFRALPGAGTLEGTSGRIATGEAMALDRGAWVRFEARVAGGRIIECRFLAWGCPHVLAAAALAARWLAGEAGEPARRCEAASLAGELDAPAEKMGRLLVVEDAGRALLADAARVQ